MYSVRVYQSHRRYIGTSNYHRTKIQRVAVLKREGFTDFILTRISYLLERSIYSCDILP